MKKLVAVLILSLLLAIPLVGGAMAQVSYSSGYQVQNLSATDPAHIIITYFPQTGTEVDVEDTILAGESVTYVTIHSEAGTPFNGSVVISSDQPVAAIANTLGDFPQYGAATGSFSEGAEDFALPLVMCNNSGFDTWFNIQNAGSGTASVTIDYISGSHGADGSESITIEPGRAKTFNQASGSSTVNCGTLAGADGKFIGSATISSNEPVVATVMQINTTNFKVMMGYNGFPGGSDDVRAPLIMANNSGFYTGIQVQNVGALATTVTIDYAPNTQASGKELSDDSFALAPGASWTIIHSGSPASNGGVNDFTDGLKYIGAATISSSNGEPLVAIVNQVYPGSPAYGTAYEGLNADDATFNISAPLVMSNNSTYYTGIQVQNVGTVATTVTIDYGPNTGGTFAPANEVFDLAAGASWTIIQNGAVHANGSTVNSWTGVGTYLGSATITANAPIVAIVNEVTLSPSYQGDQFYTYDAFNY